MPAWARQGKTLLDALDEWTEHFEAQAMISRRTDLRYTPEEWSAILTRGNGEAAPGQPITEQFQGHGMKPDDAIERALSQAGVNPCAACGWAQTCGEDCHS